MTPHVPGTYSTEQVTLPSGATVTVKRRVKERVPPNIAKMFRTTHDPTTEDLQECARATRYLISRLVVSPQLDPEDILDLPPEDVDALFAIMTNRTRLR